jgi:hypothetical protein
VPPEMEVEVRGLFQLEALRDSLNELLQVAKDTSGIPMLMTVLVDEYGWMRYSRRPNAIRKLVMASSDKYWTIEVSHVDGRIKVKFRYAGGVE